MPGGAVTVAYLDMIGGASGDMLLGSMVDAGLHLDALRSELAKLPDGGYELSAERVERGALYATLLRVCLNDEGRRPRGFGDFLESVSRSSLSVGVKSRSKAIFDSLLRAESAAHGGEPGHLHELATVDTLVDVVGAVVGLELLGVKKFHASPFPAGCGTARTEHGAMGGVSPAALAIYRASGAPVRTGGAGMLLGEAVTPTGAAIVAELASFTPLTMDVERSGYGAGERDPQSHANVVGLWLGKELQMHPAGLGPAAGGLTLLETNIDDMPGEMFGHVQDKLFRLGALDVWMTPVQMKKNRPGVMLSALVRDDVTDAAARLILAETSTFGVRRRLVERYEADRETVDLDSSLGRVRVKVKKLDGESVHFAPEYEDCRRIALSGGLALGEVMERVREEARSRCQADA